jgi:hypothetical protein
MLRECRLIASKETAKMAMDGGNGITGTSERFYALLLLPFQFYALLLLPFQSFSLRRSLSFPDFWSLGNALTGITVSSKR